MLPFSPARQDAPTAEEMGHCDSVRIDEFGDTSVVIFQQGLLSYFNCLIQKRKQ